jgi:hypothetical protein
MHATKGASANAHIKASVLNMKIDIGAAMIEAEQASKNLAVVCGRFILPNVKDEPRPPMARLMRQHQA